MNKRRFLTYNLVGGVLWTGTVILAAYWIGSKIPNIDKYIVILLIIAMVLTSGSIFLGLIRSKAKRRELKNALAQEFRYIFKKQ